MKKNFLGISVIISSATLLSFNTFADNQQMKNSNSMQQLKQNAKSALTEAQLKATAMKELGTYNKDVTVMIKDQTVYLIGELPSDTAYEEVVTNVESSKDIEDVNVDELKVKDSQQPLKDTYITAKIKGTLIKYDLFNKDIPSWTISVETKDGVVYLSGTVKTEKDKLAVLNVVKDVKDIKSVEDTIKVSEAKDEKQ